MKEKYRTLFFRYIYEKLNLAEIEEELKNNKIECITNESLMCEEEKICSRYSKYFYLLNTVNLMSLTGKELEYLDLIDINCFIDSSVISFLEETALKTLFNSQPIPIKYHNLNLDYYYSEHYFILGLKYDELGFATGKLKTRREIENNDVLIDELIKKIEGNSKFKIKIMIFNELFERLSNNY